MRNKKAHEVALSGLLFALAIVLSMAESAITPLLGLAPGVKIGLANIVVMYAVFFMGARQALLLVVLKALFTLLTRGPVAGLLSLCGGLLSLGVMWALYHLPHRPTWFILSVCGAVAHNLGQLAGASVVLSSRLALGYAPVLLVSGLAMTKAQTSGTIISTNRNDSYLQNDSGPNRNRIPKQFYKIDGGCTYEKVCLHRLWLRGRGRSPGVLPPVQGPQEQV